MQRTFQGYYTIVVFPVFAVIRNYSKLFRSKNLETYLPLFGE